MVRPEVAEMRDSTTLAVTVGYSGESPQGRRSQPPLDNLYIPDLQNLQATEWDTRALYNRDLHPLGHKQPVSAPISLIDNGEPGGASDGSSTGSQKRKGFQGKIGDGEEGAEDDSVDPIKFKGFFRYASRSDMILLFFGTLAAMGAGAGMPIFTLFVKELIDAGFSIQSQIDASLIESTAYKFLYLAFGLFFANTIAFWFFLLVAAHVGSRVRQAYVSAILRQDVGWFDTHKTGNIITSIEEDTAQVQVAISKIAPVISNFTTFLGGLIIAFSQGWQLALVLLGMFPVLAGAAGWMAKNLAAAQKKGQEAYAGAGAVAEQAISGVRTVASLCGEQKERERYSTQLISALAQGIETAKIQGLGFGVVFAAFMSTYSIGLWFGGWLIMNKVKNTTTGEVFSGGDVMMIFFSIVMGSFGVGQVGPAFQALRTGKLSAAKIYRVIDRVPSIDVSSEDGLRPSSVQGRIELKNVHFHYPARPDAKIFSGLNLTIDAGKTVALVGGSGSGKSTIVQLVLRFYDPLQGIVTLDGLDLRSLNVKWLRENLGIVSQEPVLFAVSIKDNIRYGKEGATDDEIDEAAKKANCYTFIQTLPLGMDTLCGERGAQMSGGQKQRIAIARAIIANPRVLLLDEATSALDTESEKLVQSALDTLMDGRTVLVVAHRLSTIRDADSIVVFKHGKVVERGTHDELAGVRGGVYADLVEKQMAQKKEAASTLEVTDYGGEGNGINHIQSMSLNDKEYLKSASQDAEAEERRRKSKGSRVWRAASLNKPEWLYGVLGVLGASVNGSIFPLLTFLLTNMITAFFLCNEGPDGRTYTYYQTIDECQADCYLSSGGGCAGFDTFCGVNANGVAYRTYATEQTCFGYMSDIINVYAIAFAGIAVAACLANILQSYCFGLMGEQLTRRIRSLVFAAILRQEIGFFDLDENSTGALTSKLASESALVKGAVGQTLGLLVQNGVLIGFSLILAFIRGWLLTLICVATFPMMVLGAFFQFQIMKTSGSKSMKSFSRAAGIASEAISGIRTVAAFSKEDKIMSIYQTTISKDTQGVFVTEFINGLGQGFALFSMFFLYFCGYAGGAFLMRTRGYQFQDVLQVFFAITFMGRGVGQAAALVPDVGKARPALEAIFKLVDREPSIDVESESGLQPEQVRGEIKLRNVTFRYPSRPEQVVLHSLSLTVPVGKSVALVGSSGSGKSTVISLVERFYDPESGSVHLDGHDLRSLNLKWLRKHLGLVSQEPVLFATSVLENIRYGFEGASVEEVKEAAKKSNAYDFVTGLPDGFDTVCGERGTQMSGGQKQRIAIARAIIANPRVLLLDEATSALDTEAEKLVQSALDTLMEGRTTLVVAHRLSTIRNADSIVVFKTGQVVETGTHEQLIANKEGFYSELVRGQMSR